MPKTIAEVISNLAGKGKVDLTDAKWANALSAPDLTNLTIPDELYEAIDNSLLSMEAAKGNHPDIKAYYMSQAYDGLDKQLNALLDEEKVPDDIKREILAERSTPKRALLITRKIKELESKKANAGKGQTEQLAAEIRDLQEALRVTKEGEGKIREEYEGKLKAKDMGFAMQRLMSSYNNTIHENLPPAVKNQIIEAQLNAALKENNASWGLDEAGNITLLRADGNPVYSPNNTPMTPKAFVDKVLSDNKQLKINDPAPPAPGANQQRYNTPGLPPVNQVPGRAVNSTQLRNQQALADLEKAPTA